MERCCSCELQPFEPAGRSPSQVHWPGFGSWEAALTRSLTGDLTMETKIDLTVSTDRTSAATSKPIRKSALVLKLLGRAKGATLAEMMEPTGWQPHSTRAYLSRLRTKGMTVTREQRKSGATAYRITAAAPAVTRTVHRSDAGTAKQSPGQDANTTVDVINAAAGDAIQNTSASASAVAGTAAQ